MWERRNPLIICGELFGIEFVSFFLFYFFVDANGLGRKREIILVIVLRSNKEIKKWKEILHPSSIY